MYLLYGLAAALFFWFLGGAPPLLTSGMIYVLIALVWILWLPTWGLLLPSLHKAETKVSPRILTLLQIKRNLRRNSALLGAWSFLSLFVAVLPFMKDAPHEWTQNVLVCGWFILTGLVFEWLTRQYFQAAACLNPFEALTRMEKEVLRAKGPNSDLALNQWSEVVEEVAARSLDRDATALASASVQTLCTMTEGYIQNNDARLSVSAPEESQHAARYVLHNVLEKYADLHARARKEGHHGICEQILAGCGKLAIVAAEKNPVLAGEPIERIGQLGLDNMETDKRDLGLKTTRLLVQIFKRIGSQKRAEKGSLENPTLTLLCTLENIAKESFRKNKETPIPLLAEPFKEIETLFTEGTCSTYPEAPVILQKTRQVLSDFANLELILRTLPTLPSLETPTEDKGGRGKEEMSEEGQPPLPTPAPIPTPAPQEVKKRSPRSRSNGQAPKEPLNS